MSILLHPGRCHDCHGHWISADILLHVFRKIFWCSFGRTHAGHFPLLNRTLWYILIILNDMIRHGHTHAHKTLLRAESHRSFLFSVLFFWFQTQSGGGNSWEVHHSTGWSWDEAARRSSCDSCQPQHINSSSTYGKEQRSPYCCGNACSWVNPGKLHFRGSKNGRCSFSCLLRQNCERRSLASIHQSVPRWNINIRNNKFSVIGLEILWNTYQLKECNICCCGGGVNHRPLFKKCPMVLQRTVPWLKLRLKPINSARST